mgnify:CR=1 FL=1
MMRKKAYMRTFEAVLAIVISFLVLTFIMQTSNPTETKDIRTDLSPILRDNPQFRNCALSNNISCLNNTMQLHYPDFTRVHSYKFNITTDPEDAPPSLPEEDIFAESIFIAGNNTYLHPRIVRLYYWDEQ